MTALKIYITWVKDGYGNVHNDLCDEYPERVTFNSLRKEDGSKVDFDMRRLHHLDAFCDEHGFTHGMQTVDVEINDD